MVYVRGGGDAAKWDDEVVEPGRREDEGRGGCQPGSDARSTPLNLVAVTVLERAKPDPTFWLPCPLLTRFLSLSQRHSEFLAFPFPSNCNDGKSTG